MLIHYMHVVVGPDFQGGPIRGNGGKKWPVGIIVKQFLYHSAEFPTQQGILSFMVGGPLTADGFTRYFAALKWFRRCKLNPK